MIKYQDEITHLIHINGFEIELDNPALWELAHSRVREAAKIMGKNVIPVVSNYAYLEDITMQRLKGAGRPYPNFGAKGFESFRSLNL